MNMHDEESLEGHLEGCHRSATNLSFSEEESDIRTMIGD